MHVKINCFLCPLFFVLLFGVLSIPELHAQNTDTYITVVDSSLTYKVTKYSRVYYIGKILSIDEREVVMMLPVRGKLVIPAHEIISIKVLDQSDFDNSGDYLDPESDLSHFILNTNALGLKKNEVELGISWLGPSAIFGISDRKNLRATTTWVGAPIMMTYTYQLPLADKLNLSVGVMGTWLSWLEPLGGIVLPYAGLTMGSARNNITLSGGYGYCFGWSNNFKLPYYSIAGIVPVNKKLSLLLDTYLTEEILDGYNFTTGTAYQYSSYQGMGLLAARWTFWRSNHLQFGGGVILSDSYLIPFPLFQFFKKF